MTENNRKRSGSSGTAAVSIKNAGVTMVTALYNSESTTGTAVVLLTVSPAAVPVPTAIPGLKWTGEEQTGVASGAGYYVSGGSATEAGSYTATATLINEMNTRWSDGTTEPKVIPWSIAKAEGPAAPAEPEGIAPETAENKDGKITGVTDAMEYRKIGQDSWTDVSGSEISGLTPGKYDVRYRETATHEAGAAASISVPEYIAPEPLKTIVASVTEYSGDYDGQPHGIEISVTEPETGWVLRYGTTEGTYHLDTSPVFTDAGIQTVYYQISAEGYATEEGTASVEIIPASPEVTPPRPVGDIMYSDGPLVLVTAGSVDEEMASLVYAVTMSLLPPAEESFTTQLPEAWTAGTWYVWYKAVIRDTYRGNYQDSNLTAMAVTVYKPELEEASFRLPAQVTTIEANAFEGNAAITTVDAGNCSVIGAEAFKDCMGLTQIRLPKNCRIDPTVFTGCGRVFVFAPEEGTTEESCGKLINCNCIFVSLNP